MRRAVEICKALSSETRVRIIELLKKQTLCVNALQMHIEVSQSAVSQHLKVLKNAGLIKAEKRGYWMHYSVDEASLEKFRASINAMLECKKVKKKQCRKKCMKS